MYADLSTFFIFFFFSKIYLPPFLPQSLNFCIKCNNTFILEMMGDGAILAEFWPRGYMQSSVPFSKNHSNTILGGHPEFRLKMQKMCLSKKLRDRAISSIYFPRVYTQSHHRVKHKTHLS